MNNVDRFNIYTAQIFAHLYVVFPVPRGFQSLRLLMNLSISLTSATTKRSGSPSSQRIRFAGSKTPATFVSMASGKMKTEPSC
jgi:hypothetical protein